MITANDIVREGQIRRLALQLKHADRMLDVEERRRLWECLRDQVMARRPEMVLQQERMRGLAK